MASDGFLPRSIEFVKEYLQDSLEAKRWTTSRVTTLVSLANRLVAEELLKATPAQGQANYAEYTVDIVAGQKDYAFPGNFRRFRRLVQRDSSSGIISSELLPADPEACQSGIILLDQRRGFRVFPTPLADSSDWTLEYEAAVIPGLLEAVGDAYDKTAGELTLGAETYGSQILVEGWYNNSWLRICNHASGLAVGERRRITDYAADGTITLESPFTDDLAVDASPWTFEVLPCLDNPLDHAIILRAVMLIHSSGGNYKGRGLIQQEYMDVLKSALCSTADITARTGPNLGSDFLDPSLTESYI
jgi:hypothetical protein